MCKTLQRQTYGYRRLTVSVELRLDWTQLLPIRPEDFVNYDIIW